MTDNYYTALPGLNCLTGIARSEATKQRSNEATKQRSNEATKQRSNEATKQRSNPGAACIKRWIASLRSQ
jgi:hypothetical protein